MVELGLEPGGNATRVVLAFAACPSGHVAASEGVECGWKTPKRLPRVN